jgi:hypothetical protein
MAPAEDDGEPIESQRIVEIPMGALSQNPNLGSSSNQEARQGTSNSVGGGGRRPGISINTGNGGNGGGRPNVPSGGGAPIAPGGMAPPMPR